MVRFAHDPAIVSRMRTIQRRRWLSDRRAWLVDPHWPSVRCLLRMASELGWAITSKARAAEEQVRADGESMEYSVDVVHDHCGQAWFMCKLGDDDELRHRVSEIPGADWDDGWWIPTDWEQCCKPLLEIVEADMRIELSPAAERLLTEEDVAHLHVRSSVPETEPTAWDMQLEQDLEAQSDPALDSAQTRRKPRVTTRNKRSVSAPEAPGSDRRSSGTGEQAPDGQA